MPLVPLTAACLLAASSHFNVPPLALISVLRVEGGHLGEASPNKNGTHDLGPMQVNTVHIPEVVAATGTPYTVVYEKLRDDGCYNMLVGTWVISQMTQRRSGNLWEGLGDYHSKTPHLHQRYQGKLLQEAQTVVQMVNKGAQR